MATSLVPAIEDLVTRLFNVHWAGDVAIFVALTNAGPFRIGVKRGNPPVIISHEIVLPDSPKGPISGIICCDYVNRLFLIAGMSEYQEFEGATGGATAACILVSKDGFDWKHVFMSETGTDFDPNTEKTHPIITQPNAIVWQDGVLYFSQHVNRFGIGQVETPTGFNSWRQDQIFYSTNGVEWSPRHSEQIWYGAETGGWRSTFPGYCIHNNCRDELNQNVPDGIMWREIGKPFELKPSTPPTIYYGIPTQGGGDSNSIVSSIHGTRAVTGLDTVKCVAGRNGIWMAGGFGGAALSFDVGKTWQEFTIVDRQGTHPPVTSVISIAAARGQVLKGELVVIPSPPEMQDELPEDIG